MSKEDLEGYEEIRDEEIEDSAEEVEEEAGEILDDDDLNAADTTLPMSFSTAPCRISKTASSPFSAASCTLCRRWTTAISTRWPESSVTR